MIVNFICKYKHMITYAQKVTWETWVKHNNVITTVGHGYIVVHLTVSGKAGRNLRSKVGPVYMMFRPMFMDLPVLPSNQTYFAKQLPNQFGHVPFEKLIENGMKPCL